MVAQVHEIPLFVSTATSYRWRAWSCVPSTSSHTSCTLSSHDLCLPWGGHVYDMRKPSYGKLLLYTEIQQRRLVSIDLLSME